MSQPTPSPELPDLDRLEALARAATPGPWDVEDGEVGHDVAPFVFVHKPGEDGAPGDGMRVKVEQHHMYPARKPASGGPAWNRLADGALNNAAFIAAANPAAVLALIALARRAQPEGEARPTDDKLWDETLRDRDTYHEWADKLADAIAIHLGVDIGEHSNANCPWHEALEAIESASPPSAAVSKAWDRFERAVGKPEGEAPQAWMRVTDITEWTDTEPETDGWTPLFAHTPAAQHAESGAQTTNEPYSAKLAKREAPAAEVRAAERVEAMHKGVVGVFADIKARHLAAQSQGAQAAELCIGFANNDQGVHVNVLQRHADGTAIVLHQGRVPAGDSFARFAIDAKAEAPTHCDPAEGFCAACREQERAQQAAAPGTLDADEMTRLRRLMRAIGWDHERDESDRIVRGTLFAVLGRAADKLEQAAPSAPGTPEAPTDARHPIQPLVEDAHGCVRFKRNAIVDHLATDKLNDLAAMDFPAADWEQLAQLIGYSLGGFAELSYVTDETYDRAAAQPVVPRAAQLDGGQGEGA